MVVRSRSKSYYSVTVVEEWRFLLSPSTSIYMLSTTTLRSITRKHARSVSLPSRSHPLVPQLDEHLSKVRGFEATTTSTLSSMSNRLTELKNLYDSTDDILVLPHIQQAVSQECQEKWADELLDGYLRLLDACSSTRDFSRRKSKKIIQKALKELRSIRSRQSIIATEKDNETVAVLSLIKEVETITLTMFESFLFHLHGRKQQTGWSLVSKLMNASTNQEEMNGNEFDEVDAMLHTLISQKQSNKDDQLEKVEAVQNQLENILSSIHIVEDELECLFRRLIKSRVSLLNTLNH